MAGGDFMSSMEGPKRRAWNGGDGKNHTERLVSAHRWVGSRTIIDHGHQHSICVTEKNSFIVQDLFHNLFLPALSWKRD